MAPITDLGTAIITGFAAAFATLLSAIPAILGALIVLVIGWIVAGWLAGLLVRGLRLVKFDQLAERAGVQKFTARAGVQASPAEVLGGIVKWYVRLVFVLMAANAVGLTAISTVVNGILAFIPNLIVAGVILAAFAWLAGVTRTFARGALGSMPNADAIAMIAAVAVFAFGAVAAVDQLGVATTIVTTLFAGVVAALALTFGLAFGLGGREEAARIWSDMRGSAAHASRQNGPQRSLMTEAEQRRRREELARSS